MIDRDEIIKLAREAGFDQKSPWSEVVVRHSNGSFVDVLDRLERFTNLVAAAEREACACIAERAGYRSNGAPAYEHIAAAIRARSST